jgi:hypothetical protein
MLIISPHKIDSDHLGPESLPRSPTFRDDGELQARLFAQILDGFTAFSEGLQKTFAIKLGLYHILLGVGVGI